jgi:hypothetical protein
MMAIILVATRAMRTQPLNTLMLEIHQPSPAVFETIVCLPSRNLGNRNQTSASSCASGVVVGQ